MGKAKRKGGLTGVSRFVFETMASQSEPPPTSQKTLEKSDQHTSKKRKGNDGEIVAENEAHDPNWIQKYDATGLVPHYSQADQVPEHLKKYFSQRYRYFSLYSSPPGCLLDEEGWYSVTPELVADQIAERCRCDTILDAFCGVGGNAIAFAKTCQRVIALDTSPTRLALARHNAQIYGVADRIEFILTDFLSFAKSYLSLPSLSHPATNNSHPTRKIDVVFLSPPWGGLSYLAGSTGDITSNNTAATSEHPSYSLSLIQPIHGVELFDLTRKITKNVAFYLPRNTQLDEVSSLLSTEKERNPAGSMTTSSVAEQVEVEEEWIGTKLKALTCYFGGLVEGQGEMF